MNPSIRGRLWVALQFGLLGALAVLCALQEPWQPPGLAVAALWLASAALGVWTLTANRPGNFNIRPEPRPDGYLVQDGPYRWMRHPMYTSVLLLAAGAAVWLGSFLGAGLWLALVGVLLAKSRLEEQWLLQRYPEYAAYRQRTWRWVPGVY